MSTEDDRSGRQQKSREEARAALTRATDNLQEVLAQGAEVTQLSRSLRQIRQGDAFALDLERAMRGRQA